MSRLVPKHKCGDVLEEIDPEKHGEHEPIRWMILEVYNTDNWLDEDQERRGANRYCFYYAVKCHPSKTIWGRFGGFSVLYTEEWDMDYKCIGHIDLGLLINGNEQIPMMFSKSEEQP